MIKKAITVSLVEEARGGPFVFWNGLQDACEKAGALGFDAVEIFTPAPDAFDAAELHKLLDDNNVRCCAIGTGAGWVLHRLSLTAVDSASRSKAQDFIKSIIDAAGEFGASAIIGSMQGKAENGVSRETALGYLGEGVQECAEYAKQYNVPLIYEPLNRYETNLCNTVADGVALLEGLSTDNAVLLADLFHMNIEEVNVADALRAGGKHIGHTHFVDSNRRPAGGGHTDFAPIVDALNAIGYEGYACAEAFAYPNPDEAARATIAAYNSLF
jgi:sugar phosphate isomerase/epimerase